MPDKPERSAWSTLRWILLGIVLIVGGIAVWLFVIPYNPGAGGPNFTISRETTYITEPLDDRGRPDYVAWLNARATTKPSVDDNGYVAYLATVPSDYRDPKYWSPMLDALGIDRLPEHSGLTRHDSDTLTEQLFAAPNSTWTDDAFAELSTYLDDNRGTLDAIVSAWQTNRWHEPVIVRDDGILAMNTVSLGTAHSGTVTDLVLARAMRSAARGDAGAAARDLSALMRYGAHLSECYGPADYMFGVLMRGIANIGYERIAKRYELTPEGWAALADSLDAAPPMREFWRVLDEDERVGLLDLMVKQSDNPKLFDEDGFGPNHVYHRFVDWDSLLVAINQRFDAIVAATRVEVLSERHSQLQSIDTQMPSIPQSGDGEGVGFEVSDSMTHLLIPAYISAQRKHDRVSTHIALARTALRIAEHRARHGEYPSSLTDIVAYREPGPPIDPYANAPLRYRRIDNGYVLYSIGEDFDDDGGREPNNEGNADEDGDIVFRVGDQAE